MKIKKIMVSVWCISWLVYESLMMFFGTLLLLAHIHLYIPWLRLGEWSPILFVVFPTIAVLGLTIGMQCNNCYKLEKGTPRKRQLKPAKSRECKSLTIKD